MNGSQLSSGNYPGAFLRSAALPSWFQLDVNNLTWHSAQICAVHQYSREETLL